MKISACLLSVPLAVLSPSPDAGALGFVWPVMKTTFTSGAAAVSSNRRRGSDSGSSSSSRSCCRSSINGRGCGARGQRIMRAPLQGAPSPSDGSEDSSSSGSTGGGSGGISSGSSSSSNGSVGDEEGGANKADGAGAESEPASLASLVESTFVLAAAGNSYQMGLKAFISTVKEAYERGYTVPALTMEVSFVPTKTAGRELYPEEVELRSIWIALVYLTLENAKWPQKVPRAHEISAPLMDRFSEFVKKVMNASARGHTFRTLKVPAPFRAAAAATVAPSKSHTALEEVMRRGSEPRTPLEAAVLSQSMRIVFATLDLMAEGWSG